MSRQRDYIVEVPGRAMQTYFVQGATSQRDAIERARRSRIETDNMVEPIIGDITDLFFSRAKATVDTNT